MRNGGNARASASFGRSAPEGLSVAPFKVTRREGHGDWGRSGLRAGDSELWRASHRWDGERREGSIAQLVELHHSRRRHRLRRRHRAMRRQRVDEGAVFLQSIVEVRTRREAGRSDATDELALTHARTGVHGDGREVQIFRLEAVRVAR